MIKKYGKRIISGIIKNLRQNEVRLLKPAEKVNKKRSIHA